MKISELIFELATVQQERGDVEVMMEFIDMDEEEVIVLTEAGKTCFSSIESVSLSANGFRYFALLHT